MTNRPGVYSMPDQIWIADWNGRADADSEYVRDASWANHQRVHQYRGGHNETWGGVTINIDSNFLDVGRGSVARRAVTMCNGTSVDYADLPQAEDRRRGRAGRGRPVPALPGGRLRRSGRRRLRRGHPAGGPGLPRLGRDQGRRQVDPAHVDGAAGPRQRLPADEVRRGVARRTPAAACAQRRRRRPGCRSTASSRAGPPTAVKAYQRDHGLRRTGVVTGPVWRLLRNGVR